MVLSVCCPPREVMAQWRCRKEGLFIHPACPWSEGTHTLMHPHTDLGAYTHTHRFGNGCAHTCTKPGGTLLVCVYKHTHSHHSPSAQYCEQGALSPPLWPTQQPAPHCSLMFSASVCRPLWLTHQLVGHWIELRAQVHVTCEVLAEGFLGCFFGVCVLWVGGSMGAVERGVQTWIANLGYF